MPVTISAQVTGKVVAAAPLQDGGSLNGLTVSINNRGIVTGDNAKSGWISINTSGQYIDKNTHQRVDLAINGVSFWVNRGGENWWNFSVQEVKVKGSQTGYPFITRIDRLGNGNTPVLVINGRYELVPVGSLNSMTFQQSK
jgi:hypothetical protein